MLTTAEENLILANAYVPEHIVGLMTYLSGGEPFLIESYFCLHKDDWIIVVGYPLTKKFLEQELESVLEKLKKKVRFSTLWLIAPKIPAAYEKRSQERESDHYYTLPLKLEPLRSDLKRTLNKARNLLLVEKTRQTGPAHRELSQEFIERTKPHPRVGKLLLKSRDYVYHSQNAFVLNAWNKQKKLSAFYVIDGSAERFTSYVIGCHSKKHYVPGASDLLLHETIEISAEMKKEYVHLGLGVNEGIRRFKLKWGGRPTLPYEMCGLDLTRYSFLHALLSLRFVR